MRDDAKILPRKRSGREYGRAILDLMTQEERDAALETVPDNLQPFVKVMINDFFAMGIQKLATKISNIHSRSQRNLMLSNVPASGRERVKQLVVEAWRQRHEASQAEL
jgi:hypothetical protein